MHYILCYVAASLKKYLYGLNAIKFVYFLKVKRILKHVYFDDLDDPSDLNSQLSIKKNIEISFYKIQMFWFN